MRDRGKALETYGGDLFSGANNFYSSSSGLPCKKHPSASPVGVCPYCLRDRLLKLICSDCGEQRLSSCSCSEISISSASNRNSCAGEVGSVGRMSFLIENEKPESLAHSKPIKNCPEKAEQVVVLKRSSSSCVEIKKSGGLWKIGKLFRKKREKAGGERSVAGGCDDEKSEMWLVDYMGVSRSRSLCSFRGSNLYNSEDGPGDYLPVSAARSSISAARSSGVNVGMAIDSGRRSGFSEAEPRKSGYGYNSEAEPRKSCFSYNSEAEPRKSSFGYNSEAEPRRSGYSHNSEAEPRRSGYSHNSEAEPRKSSFSYNSEAEPRKSGFDDHDRKPNQTELDPSSNATNRRIFSLKESDFCSDSGFIDLKFDFSNPAIESKTEYSAAKTLSAFGSMRGGQYDHDHDHENDRSLGRNNMYGAGNASCRITVSDRGIKRSRKSFKGWGWIFKNHPNSRSARKKDEDVVTFNPCYR